MSSISSDSVIMIMIGLIIFLLLLGIGFVIALFMLSKPKDVQLKKEAKDDDPDLDFSKEKDENKKSQAYGKFTTNLTRESIFDFMEFDEVIDSMIVRKNREQYVMVLQCNGVNYDLMSENEKVAVEEGFVQFLNTLRFPIQLYVQSRTLNLRDIITEYKNRIESLQLDIEKLTSRIAQAKMQGNRALKEKLEFEKRRKTNILEYGINITDYVEKMSSNKNVLQQKTYVIVSYYSAELGQNLERYSKEEIYNMCFSELYTRCQNIASALGNSQITSEILDSEQLAELLYIAYNRDESEFLQLQKALDAQFDSLYTTGKDVLEKKQEMLDKEISLAAIDLATDSILKADKQKQIEEIELTTNKDFKIKQKAEELLSQYENQLDPRVYQLAKENINNSGNSENKKEEVNKESDKESNLLSDGKKKVKIVKKKIIKKKIEE